MTFPKVTIIILNWNGKEDTLKCIESLKNINYPNYEIFVVDNGSTDESVKFLFDKYPELEIIENNQNLGFAAGNNVGIIKALDNDTDYVLILNNDTVVDNEFLTNLVEVAEEYREIGIVGPKIYQYENKQKELLSGAKILYWKGCLPRQHKNMENTTDVDMISGCCMLIKRQVFEDIGKLDSTYFFGWEDAEFCVNAKKNGFRIVCNPKARIYHKVGGSYGGHYASNPIILTEGIRNQLIFISRHASSLHKLSSFFFLIPNLLFIVFWKNEGIHDLKTRVVSIKNGFLRFVEYNKLKDE